MRPKGWAALVLDLDGTLIGRDQQISTRVSAAVRKVSDTIRVSISTGREPSDVIRFARELGLDTPQVSDNGALMLDPTTEEELWSAPLEPDSAKRIINRLQHLRLPFIATHPGGTLTADDEIADWNITRVSALDMEEKPADDLVTYFQSSLDLHVVKVSLPYNGMWAVDLTRTGVNKATAVRRLSAMLDIDTSRMIAAGDSYNDLPLLETCGLGIAMGDAPDELKAIADCVAPSVDEDGLAVAIEEFVIPRL